MKDSRLSLDGMISQQFGRSLCELEERLDRDVITVCGPIMSGLDLTFRDAVEAIEERRPRAGIILDTPGGVVEVVERMVETVRHFYDDISFIIPDKAMSAGTIFALSGDSIMMDHFSRLGPIDPQVVKDDRLVPALSYLIQYERLLEKDRRGELCSAEFALLSRFDLAELHQYEQARELSHRLLVKWLAKYKFKDWKVTETQGTPVDDELRQKRALEIARTLSDNEHWHSHGRGISMEELQEELNLRIDCFGADFELARQIRTYHECIRQYAERMRFGYCVHTRGFFLELP